MKSEISSEGDFQGILREVQKERKSVASLLEHPKFIDTVRRICYRCNFQQITPYNAEDLYQDVCLKLFELEPTLQISGNILTEEDFFNWLFVVVRNHYYSTIRQHIAQKRDGLRSDKPVEEFQTLAYDVDFEGKVFLSQFLKFTEKYPDEMQLAVALWLNDYSYRDMEEILRGEGIQCSHATVRNWITGAVRTFTERISLPANKSLLKRVLK